MKTLNIKIRNCLMSIILFAILFFTASSSFASDSNKYNSKSYFTGKNAIPLNKGEGYIQNTLPYLDYFPVPYLSYAFEF